jgi:hypothetical protein
MHSAGERLAGGRNGRGLLHASSICGIRQGVADMALGTALTFVSPAPQRPGLGTRMAASAAGIRRSRRARGPARSAGWRECTPQLLNSTLETLLMERKLHLLDSFFAHGSDGARYKVCAYEHLVRDETVVGATEQWEPTGTIEYRLADGGRIDARRDGSMSIAATGVALSRPGAPASDVHTESASAHAARP